ncbi:hypothetical protein [Bradyrhizobium sp. WSM3983]|uniref:hypothetical protein n=1 Tax=Bradyrhizobium sp. WSM3983 TaxID=1038867 RepID=UPI0012ECAC03|nr:hypothetical protein [Bradyrhizobium sp. WSM3983]
MTYADLYVDEPLEKIAEDWDYLNDRVVKRFFGFKPVGDNVVGIRPIVVQSVGDLSEREAPPVGVVEKRTNFEIGPQGVVVVPRIPFSAHITRAGTPHRVQHLFGYWHVNDKDEICVVLPPDGNEPGRLIIVMGKPTGDETDRFAWYCEKCTTLLFMRELNSGRDFSKFWAGELAAVREYNANPRHQICPSCGHKNPLAYSGMRPSDNEQEHAARLVW